MVSVAYTDLVSDARVLRAARAVKDAGARVTVVVPSPDQDGAAAVPTDLEVVWLPVPQERGRTTLFGQLRFLHALRRWVGRQHRRPDAVHVHNMPDYLYWPLRRWHRQGAWFVLDVHDVMSELALHRFSGMSGRFVTLLLRAAERLVWMGVDHIVTVHEPYRRLLMERGVSADRVSVVMNTPDPALCSPSKRRLPLSQRFKVVFHGTVSARTGVLRAVEALPLVIKELPSTEFLIVGGGNGVTEVWKAIARLGLNRHVTFIDRYVALDQVFDAIVDADVAVVPNEVSRYTERILPVKLLEYAALGIPTVATRLPVIDEYFAGAGLHLIASPTPEAIAAGLLRIARDASYRSTLTAAAMRVVEEHSWDRYSRVLQDALKVARWTVDESQYGVEKQC